jgi:ATP-binding cassette subfamily F protein uup
VTSTFVFEGDGVVAEYTGGYEDWVRQRDAVKPPISPAPAAVVSAPAVQQPKPAKIEKGRKFLNREQRELDELPGLIEALEARQATLSERLADPALYQQKDGAFQLLEKELNEIHHTIETSLARWEELEKLRAELAG